MKYHSRSRIKSYLSRYSEILTNMPSLTASKDDCEGEWKLSTSFITSFVEQIKEYLEESKEKATA